MDRILFSIPSLLIFLFLLILVFCRQNVENVFVCFLFFPCELPVVLFGAFIPWHLKTGLLIVFFHLLSFYFYFISIFILLCLYYLFADYLCNSSLYFLLVLISSLVVLFSLILFVYITSMLCLYYYYVITKILCLYYINFVYIIAFWFVVTFQFINVYL